MKLLDELIRRKVVVSKSEGRRLIHMGAVQVNKVQVKDPNAELEKESNMIKVGHRGVFGDIQFDEREI